MTREEVVRVWYDSTYVPGVRALRQERVPEAYSYKTAADLFCGSTNSAGVCPSRTPPLTTRRLPKRSVNNG
jgi:hypothetical protein